jgi:hypothetical protein
VIIGLEGVSCTGKTTLARHLADALDAAVIDCYFHCAPTPESMPPPESADAEHQLIAVTQLLRIESLRIGRAQATSTPGAWSSWTAPLTRSSPTPGLSAAATASTATAPHAAWSRTRPRSSPT